MPARQIIEAVITEEIQFGWVRGDHVVFGDYSEGEDSHHFTQRREKLPDGSDEGWKRWRFNSNLNTIFWWEAPTLQERDAVANEIGGWRTKHVYVELHSSPKGDREVAARYMPTANLDDIEQDNPDLSAEIMDVTHYPDRPSGYVDRWLRTVGD